MKSWPMETFRISYNFKKFLPTQLLPPTCLFVLENFALLHVYSLLHGYYIFENFPSYMVITTYMFIPDCRVLQYVCTQFQIPRLVLVRCLFRNSLSRVQLQCNSQIQDVLLSKVYEFLKIHEFTEPVEPALNRPLMFIQDTCLSERQEYNA